MNDDGVRAMLMRGGTSKGVYFVADDLPTDPAERDDFLLRMMGSPDERQIDGVGGAHPLTSKVAIVSPSKRPDADVDYLFLQLGVEDAFVTDKQNCGNLLAGVAPFAVERGLIEAAGDQAEVRVYMENTAGVATAVFAVGDGQPIYGGDTAISGVPGTAAPIKLFFAGTAGSTCGSLLPTGNVVDVIAGVPVTIVDNGMPTIVFTAESVGATGSESPTELEANEDLTTLVEEVRLEAGPLMGLDDVASLTIPKMTLVAGPTNGGSLLTRTFIPHRCHQAIGVLGAVSVATAALLPGSPAHPLLEDVDPGGTISLEHPTGHFDAVIEMEVADDPAHSTVHRAGVVRTARKLFDGSVFPR